MQSFLRHRAAQRITLLGAWANAGMAALKIVVGILGNSQALLADGVHSLSDLLSDGLVFLASHYGSQEADSNHPYGHRRIETAATVAVALLLIVAGVGILYDAVDNIFYGHVERPDWMVLWVAVLSIGINEALYFVTMRVSRRIQSTLLTAHAWHRRSDSAASLAVVIGVSAALMGYPHWDAIAAFVVGLLIIRMGARLGWSSVQELVDTGLDDATLAKIREHIMLVPGVRTIHQLRTRSMGSQIFVDVHVIVDPWVTVSEGHFVGERVAMELYNTMKSVADVTVHVDPEDDEAIQKNIAQLPTRAEILAALNEHCADLAGKEYWQDIRLHYLNDVVYLEFIFPLSLALNDAGVESLRTIYEKRLRSVSKLKEIRLLFEVKAPPSSSAEKLPAPSSKDKLKKDVIFYGRKA